MFDRAFNPKKFIEQNDSEDDEYLAEYEIPKFQKAKIVKQVIKQKQVEKDNSYKKQYKHFSLLISYFLKIGW